MSRATPTGPRAFGRYQILGRLAVGGMAEVLRAELVTAAGIRKPVVIKKILPTYAEDEAFVAMFLEEARIVSGLSHGNIAQVLDVGEIDGEPFMALEHVDGKSLAELVDELEVRGKRLPAAYACFIVLEMCKGLYYAHSRTDAERRPLNIVHRDISPQNVLLSYEGEVKLVDFGIARAYGAPDLRPGHARTATGVVKGKYAYFAPEQARAQPLDARADIYAAGVVLYELVCGRLPFEGEMVSVLRRIVRGEYVRPSELSDEVSPALEAIIVRAMATHREDRFPTALAFQEALGAYLADHAPRMSQGGLINAMRLAFGGGAGQGMAVPEDFQLQFRLWPDAVADQTDVRPENDARPVPAVPVTDAEATVEPIRTEPPVDADPLEPPTAAELPAATASRARMGFIFAAALLVVVAAFGIWATRPSAPVAMPSAESLAPQRLKAPPGAPAPTPAPHQHVDPPPPTPAAPEPVVSDSSPKTPQASDGLRGKAKTKAKADGVPAASSLRMSNVSSQIEARYAYDAYERGLTLMRSIGSEFRNPSDLDPAIRQFKIAVELEPANATYHRMLGTALAYGQHFDEAAKQLRQFIKYAPPGDPNLPIVRERLEAYEKSQP